MNILKKRKFNRQKNNTLDSLSDMVFLINHKQSMLEHKQSMLEHKQSMLEIELRKSKLDLDHYRQLYTDTDARLEETIKAKQEFEKLLESLPIRSNNLVIYGVSRVLVRPGYDSEWFIEGFNTNDADADAGEFRISITRGDGENYFSLLEKLKKVKDFSQLRSLNIKHLIWYD